MVVRIGAMSGDHRVEGGFPERVDLGVGAFERRVREPGDGRAGTTAGEYRLRQVHPEDVTGCGGPGGGAGRCPHPQPTSRTRSPGRSVAAASSMSKNGASIPS
jgi:hypothetical protein